jgi:tyrosine-protein phosphatase SIW14
MRDQLVRLRTISVIVVLLVATLGASSRESKEEALPNFHQVNENLYRGAQPEKGWVKELTALKIKTVINLRGEDEGTSAEAAEARAAGLRYFSVPLPGLSRPKDEQVEKVLAIINDSQNWPVFVHCHHGEDRTGTIIAIYRITHDGWTSEEAKKEAKKYGMSRFQFGMKSYIGDYYKHWLQHQGQQPSKAVSFLITNQLVPET